jgi:glycosyltransferase involved in cell wall biosynthesis
MPVTLTFITYHLNVGGAERQLYYLIRELDKTKYSIYLITLWPGDVMQRQFEAAGATVVPIHKTWKFDLTLFFRLTKFIRRVRPDVVHCQLYTANIWGRIAAVLAGCKKIIVSERNCDELWKTRIHFGVERILNRYATTFLGNSQRVCSYSEEKLHLPKGTYRLMYNGVDTTEFRPREAAIPAPNTGPVIGTVANLHPRKDLGSFLRMAARLLERFPDARFRVIGRGPEKDTLIQLARKLGIEERVDITWASDNVRDIYHSFDVFVLSSVHEGFANVIIEAMASGLPVVATDVGGAREAIEEGQTGFVVPTGDPEILAERVGRILEDPLLSAKMGRAGRNRAVQQFSLRAMVRRYDDLYDKLIRADCLPQQANAAKSATAP